jgi:hypothetical protein
MTSRQQHQQHQHQQHEYHALLEDVPDFTAPEDLDGFLHVVYAYHQAGGRVPAAVKALLDVLQMLFTASIVTFLLCFVDFEKLSSVERLRDAIAYQGCE